MTLAKKRKNDKFYTQLSDIENELIYYKKHFKGQTVFCNCDDPEYSNFWQYFKLNFDHLELKRLVTTRFYETKESYMLEMWKDEKGVHSDKKVLNQNGDFRSEECIELLKQADIVVTNPPFSLFREYVAQLIEYEKKFLIIGSLNAITYKEFFPLLKNNKIWLGYNHVKEFLNANGEKQKFGNVLWYTNLDHDKRHEDLLLYKKYNPEEFPKYDNYDAINVDKVSDIPVDYDGVMGVPITFFDKYNPEQFEILGSTQRGCHDDIKDIKKYDDYLEIAKNGRPTGSKGSKINENANIARNDGKHNYFVNDEGYIVQSCYGRIFIKYAER